MCWVHMSFKKFSKHIILNYRRCTDVIAVTIFSALILRELLTPVKAVCVGVCLGGVVMVRLQDLKQMY